jgi:hypothetical protein
VHWQGELTSERATIEAKLAKLHRRKSALVIEQAVTVDLTIAQAQARDVATVMNCEGTQYLAFGRPSQNVATMATLLDTLPAPSVDGVDKVYHQMKDILSIAAAQQAESSLQDWAEVSP